MLGLAQLLPWCVMHAQVHVDLPTLCVGENTLGQVETFVGACLPVLSGPPILLYG